MRFDVFCRLAAPTPGICIPAPTPESTDRAKLHTDHRFSRTAPGREAGPTRSPRFKPQARDSEMRFGIFRRPVAPAPGTCIPAPPPESTNRAKLRKVHHSPHTSPGGKGGSIRSPRLKPQPRNAEMRFDVLRHRVAPMPGIYFRAPTLESRNRAKLRKVHHFPHTAPSVARLD